MINLKKYEKRITSMLGEDGVILRIFDIIKTTNKYFVEFGANLKFDNTRYLREKHGWNGLYMDGNSDNELIKKEWIFKDNINDLFKKYDVPESFDLLSIDLDGNDYWIWKAIDSKYMPRVVIIEFNSNFPPNISKTIKYNSKHHWVEGSNYYGASLLALKKLGESKGYSLVHCVGKSNAFFVRTNLLPENCKNIPITTIFPKAIQAFCEKDMGIKKNKLKKLKQTWEWEEV